MSPALIANAIPDRDHGYSAAPEPGISGRQCCSSSAALSRPSSSRGLPCPVRRWRSTFAMNSSSSAVSPSLGAGSGLSSVIEIACHGKGPTSRGRQACSRCRTGAPPASSGAWRPWRPDDPRRRDGDLGGPSLQAAGWVVGVSPSCLSEGLPSAGPPTAMGVSVWRVGTGRVGGSPACCCCFGAWWAWPGRMRRSVPACCWCVLLGACLP